MHHRIHYIFAMYSVIKCWVLNSICLFIIFTCHSTLLFPDSESSEWQNLQSSRGGGWDHLGQYLFPVPLTAEESLPQFLLPACNSGAAGFCQTGLKVILMPMLSNRLGKISAVIQQRKRVLTWGPIDWWLQPPQLSQFSKIKWHLWILIRGQLICMYVCVYIYVYWLCWASQGRPRTIGTDCESMMWKLSSSWSLPDKSSHTGTVFWVMLANSLPSSALAANGSSRQMESRCNCLATATSKKHSSVPKSIRAENQ